MPEILNQDQMSERTVKNIIRSGDINAQRRRNDGKQVILTSDHFYNPFKKLARIRYLFEKYESYFVKKITSVQSTRL